MNPMSLLTLPAATLREAWLSHPAAAPHGERAERDVALAFVLVAIAVGIALLLGAWAIAAHGAAPNVRAFAPVVSMG